MEKETEITVIEADAGVACGAGRGHVEAGELLVVGDAMGAGGAGSPGLEAAGEVDDGGIGKGSGGMGVPTLVERQPLVDEDGVEGFLVKEVGGGAGLGEVLAREPGDVLLAPAGEINE